jgi:putative ABC transport system permease protein
MYFSQIALINILRRPFRTALTLCGVMLGIGAYVALVGFSGSFERQWLQFYLSKGTDICVVRGTFLKSSADESLGDKLRTLPIAADVTAVSFDLIDFTPEISAVVVGWEASSYEFESLTMLQGRKFQKDEAGIMLGEILAESLHKKPGDLVQIQGTSLPVVGVFRGGESFETSGALLPLHQLQRISDLGSKVAGFHVRLRALLPGQSNEERLRQAKLMIESHLPGLTAVPVGDLAQNNYMVSLVRSIAWGVSFIALFIGALGIANTMAMSVHERSREIGILRSMGWVRSRIVRLILLEASLLSMSGGILGLLCGRIGLAVLAVLRSTTPGVAHAGVSWLLCVQAMTIALGIGVAAGFLPAYRAARLSPIDALRYD